MNEPPKENIEIMVYIPYSKGGKDANNKYFLWNFSYDEFNFERT